MENILQDLQKTKISSEKFKNTSFEMRNKLIKEIGDNIKKNKDLIIAENKKDLKKMTEDNPMRDRLLLDEKRINSMSEACYDLVDIEDPLLKYKDEKIIETKDGLKIKKIGVPIGVVACIYEARPNVTIDIVIMAIKSGNGTVLRGGNQALFSNKILVKIIDDVLEKNNFDKSLIYNFPLEREKLNILYTSVGLVDVIIPRGGKDLIDSVRKKSLIPVIETGAGVVHLYLDQYIENTIDKAIPLIINAKVSRPSVCNSLDTLLINENIKQEYLEKLFYEFKKNNVHILAIEKDICILSKYFEEDNLHKIKEVEFFTEQLSLKLNIKFVESIEEGIKHIQKYSSKHSDGILSENKENIDIFQKNIDSSVIHINTSPRFSDGSCFGFGGEIGISTQKLHARGPMGAESLVTYKYIVCSDWKMR
ncbi:glutamate-5-semialdehyde dehydrogenase [Candidatus Gracilibacteria bacterium]|nr:glutamate-5-semialdehyde dehydrogenase [Candidatus Gracilibacteria bacterium]NUJ99247.1 glutamate-5-semialdehyde dehydrogenase [Candidatus Gracilibacteria bacterium]